MSNDAPGRALLLTWRASRVRWPVLAAGSFFALAGSLQPPSFHASVALLTIKVLVVAAQDKALPRLVPENFGVRLNGHDTPVVSAVMTRFDDLSRLPGSRATGPAAGRVSEDTLFQPIAGRMSALYLLGIEGVDAAPKITVKVGVKDVAVRAWAWCSVPAKCGAQPPPAADSPKA